MLTGRFRPTLSGSGLGSLLRPQDAPAPVVAHDDFDDDDALGPAEGDVSNPVLSSLSASSRAPAPAIPRGRGPGGLSSLLAPLDAPAPAPSAMGQHASRVFGDGGFGAVDRPSPPSSPPSSSPPAPTPSLAPPTPPTPSSASSPPPAPMASAEDLAKAQLAGARSMDPRLDRRLGIADKAGKVALGATGVSAASHLVPGVGTAIGTVAHYVGTGAKAVQAGANASAADRMAHLGQYSPDLARHADVIDAQTNDNLRSVAAGFVPIPMGGMVANKLLSDTPDRKKAMTASLSGDEELRVDLAKQQADDKARAARSKEAEGGGFSAL